MILVTLFMVNACVQEAEAGPLVIINSARCMADTTVEGVPSTNIELVLNSTTAAFYGTTLYLYHRTAGTTDPWQPNGIPMDMMTGNIAEYVLPFSMTTSLEIMLATGSSSSNLGVNGTGPSQSDVILRPCVRNPETKSICGRKIWDKNCNGLTDTGDVGLAGWVITLRPNNIAVMTDAQGRFCFNNLPVGQDYYIEEDQQAGWTQRLPETRDYHIYLSGDVEPRLLLFANCKVLVPDSLCMVTCNLVENGDFSQGNTLFTTDLQLDCGDCATGAYCVGPSFRNKCSSWPLTYDHTFGGVATGSSFLSIDGSTGFPVTPAIVWKQGGMSVIGALPYTFSFWGKNLYGGAGENVQVEMNIYDASGALVVNGGVSLVSLSWTQYSITWTPTLAEAAAGPYTLELRQFSADAFRDFGIDDIFFGTCPCPCEPGPLPRCDSITMDPHSYGPLDLSGKMFTVHNLKVPASPIASVTVSLSPDPFPPAGNSGYHWNGGDVVVDPLDPGSSRSWTTSNSGAAWYSEINMNCTGSSGAGQGAMAQTSVQFNLGVIETLNWAGTVTITVTHCDGETCEQTFDWCAMQNWRNCPRVPLTDQFAILNPTQLQLASTMVMIDGVDEVAVKHVILVPLDNEPDTGYRIFAVGAHETGSTEADTKGMANITGATIFSSDSAERYAARFELGRGLVRGHSVEIPIVLEIPEKLKGRDIPMIVEYYDADAQLIDRDTVNVPAPGTTAVDDPTTGIHTHGIDATLDNPEPSPTTGMVRLGYRLASTQRIRLELYDVTGNRIADIEEGRRGAGGYEIMYDAGALANGTYMVVLTTESGDVVSRPIVLQH